MVPDLQMNMNMAKSRQGGCVWCTEDNESSVPATLGTIHQGLDLFVPPAGTLPRSLPLSTKIIQMC